MFWAGVILTRVIFHFEKKWLKEEIQKTISISIIKYLWVTSLIKLSKAFETHQGPGFDAEQAEINKQMESLTKLVVSSYPEDFRKNIHFSSWKEVQSIINYRQEKEERL